MNKTPILIVDLGALASTLGSLMGYMPSVVAILAAVYYIISIAIGIRTLRK